MAFDKSPGQMKGTTTVGLVCDGSVVLAADTRATAGTLIASKGVEKIFAIEPHIGLATAGQLGDALSLVSLLRAEAKLYRMRMKTPIKVGGLATLTANIIHGQRYFPYIVQLIIGGYDTEPGIHMLDPWGGLSQEMVASGGSGSPIAYGVLESGYGRNMSVEQGIELGVGSVWAAIQRDAATGNAIQASLIDKDGYREVERDLIDKILSRTPMPNS